MLVHQFTGLKEITGLKVFKAITKLTVVAKYHKKATDMQARFDASIRVRLINQTSGETKELVPDTKLEILAEIASKYEGFQLRAFGDMKDGLDGKDCTSVLIGSEASDGSIMGIHLSNDKYLDIDLRGLDKDVEYEIWGFETHEIDQFVRKYNKFYMSVGEKEKTFSVGENEVLAIPMTQIHEIQFYPKSGDYSPVFRAEELQMCENENNDLMFVYKKGNGYVDPSTTPHYGGGEFAMISVTDYTRFDVRRTDADKAVELIMIDKAPNPKN